MRIEIGGLTIHSNGFASSPRSTARYPRLRLSLPHSDDAISGTNPVVERPDGSRLLLDAKAKKFVFASK